MAINITVLYLEVNKHGRGILYEWNSDLWYNGEFQNNLRHGSGTLTNSSNDYVYDGQWEEGQKHGIGQLMTSEFKYSGNFRNNEFHGSGVYCDKYGNIYDGEWINGKRNGISHFTRYDGSKFIGEYQDDNIHGNGQWNYANGQIFSGQYSQGFICGHGIKWYNVEKGVKYDGMWKQNKPSGIGTYTSEDGENIFGTWDLGRLVANEENQPEVTLKDGSKQKWNDLEEQIKIRILKISLKE